MIIVTAMQTADNLTDSERLDTNVTLGFALIVEICWRNRALWKGFELGFAESRSQWIQRRGPVAELLCKCGVDGRECVAARSWG